MSLLNSQIKKFLIISLVASVCLPVGIVCIVMGGNSVHYRFACFRHRCNRVRFLRNTDAVGKILIAYRHEKAGCCG